MESQSGNLGLGTSLIIPLTLRKYTQKSNRPNIYPLFFHTSRERLFSFFPSRGLYPSEVREKTYTSLTTPGLYFISSRKCEIAQSAIYQKIIRRLKLFLNIMFVKSPPQQFSVHFFCSPPTFFSSHPEKNIILSPLTRRIPPSVDYTTGHIFYPPRCFDAPAAPIGKPLRHLPHAMGEKLRIAPHCTPHTPPPRTKNGEPRRKNWGISPKNGAFRSKHPRFYPLVRAHAAQARTKKGLHPNSFVQSFIF